MAHGRLGHRAALYYDISILPYRISLPRRPMWHEGVIQSHFNRYMLAVVVVLVAFCCGCITSSASYEALRNGHLPAAAAAAPASPSAVAAASPPAPLTAFPESPLRLAAPATGPNATTPTWPRTAALLDPASPPPSPPAPSPSPAAATTVPAPTRVRRASMTGAYAASRCCILHTRARLQWRTLAACTSACVSADPRLHFAGHTQAGFALLHANPHPAASVAHRPPAPPLGQQR